jgi:hypothetical protein
VLLLTRKQATEFIRSLGYQITDSKLQQMCGRGQRFDDDLGDNIGHPGLPFVILGRNATPGWIKKRCPDDYALCGTVKAANPKPDLPLPTFGNLPPCNHEKCKKRPGTFCHFAHMPDLRWGVWGGAGLCSWLKSNDVVQVFDTLQAANAEALRLDKARESRFQLQGSPLYQ